MCRFATVWLSHSRFYGGGERAHILAILSASLGSDASPLNKGEERVASRPSGLVIRASTAVASEFISSPSSPPHCVRTPLL